MIHLEKKKRKTWWVLGMSILLRRNFLRCMTVMAAGHCRYLLFAAWKICRIKNVDINNQTHVCMYNNSTLCPAGRLQPDVKDVDPQKGGATKSWVLERPASFLSQKLDRCSKVLTKSTSSTWSFDCLSSPRAPSLKTEQKGKKRKRVTFERYFTWQMCQNISTQRFYKYCVLNFDPWITYNIRLGFSLVFFSTERAAEKTTTFVFLLIKQLFFCLLRISLQCIYYWQMNVNKYKQSSTKKGMRCSFFDKSEKIWNSSKKISMWAHRSVRQKIEPEWRKSAACEVQLWTKKNNPKKHIPGLIKELDREADDFIICDNSLVLVCHLPTVLVGSVGSYIVTIWKASRCYIPVSRSV